MYYEVKVTILVSAADHAAATTKVQKAIDAASNPNTGSLSIESVDSVKVHKHKR